MTFTPSTPATLWTRYQFSGVKGDKHEQRVSIVAQSIFQAAKDTQSLIAAGAAGDGAALSSLLATLDTFMANLHTASNALPH